MKKINIFLLLCLLVASSSMAKDKGEIIETKYNRSSIYSVLVNHTEQKFGKEIKEQFLNIPTPDQYNNHDLSIKVINVSKKDSYKDSIDAFIDNNYLASRMIAKWFDRDILTGQCSMETVKQRGIYNASEMDRELASRSARGMAMLADAGEELIGNSFLLVNEISYLDKGKTSQGIATGLRLFGAIAGAVTGISGLSDLSDNLGDMVASLKGFKVKITTYLYQLQWDDESAGLFYKMCYSQQPDEEKRLAFENNRNKFKFKYLGQVESAGSNTSFMGINEDEPIMMVRKACQRAIDQNVADLQKKHDPFRIKAPVIEAGDKIKVPIGLKEGITPDSKFEVLEPQEKDGRITYKRIAVIQPIEKQIWDNRFMAVEEMAYGADFGSTSFRKVSGSDIYAGLLVRQID